MHCHACYALRMDAHCPCRLETPSYFVHCAGGLRELARLECVYNRLILILSHIATAPQVETNLKELDQAREDLEVLRRRNGTAAVVELKHLVLESATVPRETLRKQFQARGSGQLSMRVDISSR